MSGRRSFLGALFAGLMTRTGFENPVAWLPDTEPRKFDHPITGYHPYTRLYRLVWIRDDGSPDGKVVATALVRAVERPGNMQTRGTLDIHEWLEGADTVGMPYVNKGDGRFTGLRKDWWLEPIPEGATCTTS